MSDRSNIRSGRHTVMSAILVSAAALVLGSPAYAAPSVPWLNQPVAAPAAPLQAAPTGTFPCSAADLRVSAGPAGAWHGQATQEIRLANIGANACHLPGFPSVQLMPAGEAPQTVGASEGAPQLANQRVDLAPGEEVVLLLGSPGSCDAATRPQRKVSKRLQLALPGGGLKVLDGVYVDTLCGRATVMQFQRVQNDRAGAASQPSASGLGQLTATLSAPPEASRGSSLRYTVTLTNRTANAISLASCPAYTQSVYVDGKTAGGTFALNCAGAGSQIAANSSTSFEMQVPVPAGLSAGTAKLSWKLEGGPGAGKLISVR